MLPKFLKFLFLTLLPFYRYYFYSIADKTNLPGIYFDRMGRKIGKELFFRGIVSPKLLFNPVSIVRYFEFDYVDKNIEIKPKENILDISSPFLFGFCAVKNYNIKYNYLNPDLADLQRVKKFATKIKFAGKFNSYNINAIKLPFENNKFDKVISISVIEHVNGENDSLVMQEMWRVLKPGGRLVLTFPVSKKFDVEYTKNNTYDLNVDTKDDKYFFQRIYDEENINNRLLKSIDDYEILSKNIFGEKEAGFYNQYTKLWLKKGIMETVKDPYYISKYFTYFNHIENLPGLGVIGITLRKNL